MTFALASHSDHVERKRMAPIDETMGGKALRGFPCKGRWDMSNP